MNLLDKLGGDTLEKRLDKPRPVDAPQRLRRVRFVVDGGRAGPEEIRVRCGDQFERAPGVVTLTRLRPGRCIVAVRSLDSAFPPTGGPFVTTAVVIAREGDVVCTATERGLRCTPP